ncbi:pseudouridine kinase [Dethiosulfatibacter aminovorans DSM 17477]|uniref:Pseudouridine kinase n=1 Tax=Dethiosulfatibacter aminovorans DSM 17477 TaxID=1121476 RepID=A0A1M6II74_9FIRM|nr:carbohydrate kinase family protein [Dethiosulfatibacter aminovorans]SHJ34107.1 pseudouridine kinase [Dethiosulfatibacter aminovorans DSM 17477]
MTNKEYVVVIGGANMDLLGTPKGRLIMEDSNPGVITTSAGGVGRNIAENLALLKVETKLLTAVGKDIYGDRIMKDTLESGVDTRYVRCLPKKSTSVYMSILDENNNMKLALSHMDITEEIDIQYIKENSGLIRHADIVLIDTNLSSETIDYLFSHFSDSRFVMDSVSAVKSVKVKKYLDRIYSLKANRVEAGCILGIELPDDDSIRKAVKELLRRGVRYPIISDGKKGVFYGSGERVAYRPAIPVEVVNVNGAGDAFTAGIVYGFHHRKSIEETVACGQKVAARALQSMDTVNRNLSLDDLE